MIGRRTESAALDRLFESGRAELEAIYGRRRVGKTYLVDETFAGRITFRHGNHYAPKDNIPGLSSSFEICQFSPQN